MKKPRDQWKPNYCISQKPARPTGDWRLASTGRCAVLLFQSFQDPISQFHPLRIGVTFIR